MNWTRGNPFDKAARYAAKLDGAGFLRWLLRRAVRFRRSLDPRGLSFPGQPDRTGDTVAAFEEDDGTPYAMPIEFQIAPDPEMFGRFLGFLGPLWINERPDEERGSRYEVMAGLVNLTGRGDCSRDM